MRRGCRSTLFEAGVAAILEFSQPPYPLLAALYGFYSRRLLPAVGGLVSGSRDACAYLPESVRKFPGAERLAAEMRAAGFTEITFERWHIIKLHVPAQHSVSNFKGACGSYVRQNDSARLDALLGIHCPGASPC